MCCRLPDRVKRMNMATLEREHVSEWDRNEEEKERNENVIIKLQNVLFCAFSSSNFLPFSLHSHDIIPHAYTLCVLILCHYTHYSRGMCSRSSLAPFLFCSCLGHKKKISFQIATCGFYSLLARSLALPSFK